MDSPDKKSVPKFSSFKAPQAPQSPAPRAHRSDTQHHNYHKSRSSRRYSDERSRSPRRSDRRERRRSSHGRPHRPASRDRRNSTDRIRSSSLLPKYIRENSHRASNDASVRPASSDGSTADLFIVDLQGDRHNLTYGATHRYAVPKYRRSGRGQVLGADERYRIDRDNLDNDTLILRFNDSLSSNTSKWTRPLSKKMSQPNRLLRVKAENQQLGTSDMDQDFISFGSAILNDSDAGDLGDDHSAYRSIHGKAKEYDFIPQGLELVEDGSIQNDDASMERNARHAELSRDVKANPTDVAAWLRLIDHQDLLILRPDEDSRPLTYDEQQSVADVKMSLYEKAIKQSATSLHKDRLLLGRLQEGAHLWDTKELLVQWKRTLHENAECISLWVSYLNFCQTDFQNFDFEQLMTTFTECLDLNADGASRPGKTQVQCYLFLRMTLFLREAGYLELAVGLWQAVLEFKFFQPESISQKTENSDAMTSFRDYWEAEVPRIGEDASKTWRAWAESQLNQPHNNAVFQYESRIEPSSLMSSWVEVEKERILSSLLPARTLDQLKFSQNTDPHEQYVDDPYSVVLFSDFQHMLELFQGLDSPNDLFDSFLYFCHLPHLATPENAQTTRLWGGDNFLRNDSLDHMGLDLSRWIADQGETVISISPLRFPASNFIHTTCTFFPSPDAWFDSFSSWHQDDQSRNSSIIDREWVQLILKFLVERGRPREAFNDELAEYTLGLMFAWDPKRAKKYAKTLLKKWTSSLRVCNALALMEWKSNSPDAAVQVWSSSISWSQKFPDDLKIDLGILWNSWTWELLQKDDNCRASYVLHAMPVQNIHKDAYNSTQSMASNPTSTLQAQSYLRDCQTRALAYKSLHSFVAYTDCLALLLFVEDYPIQTALEVYASAITKSIGLSIDDPTSIPYLTELLHQARARLLFFHHRTKKQQLTPIEIRNILRESTSLFPNNTIFLSLFAWNESRFNILDRIRDFNLLTQPLETRYALDSITALAPTAVQSVPITSHLLPIWSELCRPTWAGSTNHSRRAAFEKALGENMKLGSLNPNDQRMHNRFGTDNARTNIMIWKLYIIFEVYHARNIGAAKNVFYRAIRACPWSKQLFMLAFQYLQDDKICHLIPEKSKETGLRFDDLRQLYHAMNEKQLRIHVDIEDEIQAILAEREETLEGDHQA